MLCNCATAILYHHARTEKDILKIIISNHSELPIYAQIASQVREQILDGQLPEGMILPSIRKLAGEIGVSVITTARAYDELEQATFSSFIRGCSRSKSQPSELGPVVPMSFSSGYFARRAALNFFRRSVKTGP